MNTNHIHTLDRAGAVGTNCLLRLYIHPLINNKLILFGLAESQNLIFFCFLQNVAAYYTENV